MAAKWIARSLADMEQQGGATWETPKGQISTMVRLDLPQLELIDQTSRTLNRIPFQPTERLMSPLLRLSLTCKLETGMAH